jgi:hypothetical protein
MKPDPMTPREVAGILDMLDSIRMAMKDAEFLKAGLQAQGQHSYATIAGQAVERLENAWKVANGILDRGGWILGEGADTGVPVAVPRIPHPLPLEKAGAVGEGAIPDEETPTGGAGFKSQASKRQNSQQKPVTSTKKPVTKKPSRK